ncbi:hypothetical protein BJY52DRAFT_1227707 [Lactarius psammicola]|nr:hypothetical protein BJY52DRAFT_1227707 [Lactarius psammicola]
MDAGFNPNTQVILDFMSLPQSGWADYKWLLSSEPPRSTERQGDPSHHHILPPITVLSDLLSSDPPVVSPAEFSQASIQEVTEDGAPVQGVHLSDTIKCYIKEALANLKAIWRAKTPSCLPEPTRQLIRAVVAKHEGETALLLPLPEVIRILDSSQPGSHGIILPPTRPPSAASMWTHVTHESLKSGFVEEFGAFFPEPQIQDFVESIDQVLLMPVLIEPIMPSKAGGFNDNPVALETLKVELMAEISRDLSASQARYSHFYITGPLPLPKESTLPSMAEDFNLLAGLVIAALDAGVADHQGDLEQTGLTPLSWFRLTTGLLSAILRGALQSGGQKICGRVALESDDVDQWVVAEGLTKPVMQGGRVVAMANQIMEFFSHYATNDKPPLAKFYHQALCVGQNHIEKAMHLKALATYQTSVNDIQGLTKMDKAIGFLDVWKKLYMDELTKACFEDKEEWDPTPITGFIKLSAIHRVQLIRESIGRLVTDPLLDGDEITQEGMGAVAYCDSNKLEFLPKAAEELGYVLVLKDVAEEHKGWLSKHKTSPDGKHSCSGSRVEDITPTVEPVTLENNPRKLDPSTTPKARKTKGKCPLVIPKLLHSCSQSISSVPSDNNMDMGTPAPPLFFTSSYPETAKALDAVVNRVSNSTVNKISGISVPTNVCPSKEPSAPLRNPHCFLSEPATDISVYVDPGDNRKQAPPQEPINEILSQVAMSDSTRGVASSMHNPSNAMADDLLQAMEVQPLAQVDAQPLPQLTSIPLLLGLAEMLNTLQTNLVTSFTQQIADLSKWIDDPNNAIKTISAGTGRQKSKAKVTPTPGPENSTSTPITSCDTAPAPPLNPVMGHLGGSVDVAATVPTPVPDPSPAPVPPP